VGAGYAVVACLFIASQTTKTDRLRDLAAWLQPKPGPV
jgi:hypothetical protein